MTSKEYMKHLGAAVGKAAKITGTPKEVLYANYRNFKEAPAEAKRGLIIAYRIMTNYAKKANA